MDKKVEKQRASCRTMAEATKEDWEIIGNYATGFNADLPNRILDHLKMLRDCLLYTSPSPRDVEESRMPSSA